MGAIGNKPIKFRNSERFEEPELLVDLDTIRKSARDEGYVSNNAFEIERYICDKYREIKIIYENLPSDISGKLEQKNGIWEMMVNRIHPYVRQRFTLGHELGHYLYHRKAMTSFTDNVFFRNSQKSSMEYVADQFAARLLMPEADITTLLKSGVNTVMKMANIFQVSLEAMKYRLEELGYSIRKTD